MKTYENFINNPLVEFYENGQKKSEYWYLNGKRHREDGPAIQKWFENGQKRYEEWYLNGKSHREDGPAYQHWYENGQKSRESWYLNDKEYYLREEWINELKKIGSEHYEEQKMLLDAEKYNL
jgi:antitoxin component YwqK of YwqJK toxin-antitoxin module